MRVVLIEPDPPGFHVFSRFKMPRLGLPLLGAILKKQGHEVKIHLGAPGRAQRTLIQESDLIGLSTTTSTAPAAYRLADAYRRLGKKVVIGGVHATFMAVEALEHADYVVRGEAEDSFPELLRRLSTGEGPEDLPGVSYYQGSDTIHNADIPFITDLDRLPFPDFSLGTTPFQLSDVPIQTSRGCPFPCNFCSVTKMFGRKVRFRSVDHVLEELRQIPKPEVFFYDDNFCARPEYTKNLLQRMLAEELKLQFFSAQVRADVTRDLEMLELMSAAGCRQVYVGFESINPATLKEYDKRQTVEEIAEAMEVFRRFGIRVHGMFVIGADNDTKYTARETLRFVRRQRIDTIQFMMLTPLPGTDFYQQLEQKGRIISRDWQLYDGSHAVFQPNQMSPHKLQQTAINAMARFYSWKNGLIKLVKFNYYQASRRFMGWYIIRRWKWDNRKWTAQLRRLGLKAYGETSESRRINNSKSMTNPTVV